MYHRWWDGSRWGGWENLGGVILEQPECVSWGPNRIDCFARGTDAAMYHRWWDGSRWGGWENLGGVILEQPECTSWGPNRIDCFARGTDAAMYHRWWDGTRWGGWENLGGVILEQPECTSWGPNRIDCFARGTDASMYHRWWDGRSWGGWENLGGQILESPECVSWGSNRIDCFARGTDRAMYHRWWDGRSWGGWENLGGVILEKPNCATWAANRIDCFARGTDRAMYHRWWDGSRWGGWENLGGVILEEPNCVSWGADRLDCFARGTDRAMYHRWWSPAPVTTRRAFTVSRHTSVALSDADADRILADASLVLQTNNGPGDVACPVTLVRNGPVNVFTQTDGNIDNATELQQTFAQPGNVKVVAGVDFCENRVNTSFIGCGQLPGTSFITERFTASLEGILWAHEFGHNQGLAHRNDTSDALMFPSIGTNRQRITQQECNAIRGGGGGLTEAATAMTALATEPLDPDARVLMPTESTGFGNIVLAQAESGGATPAQPVQDFVRQIYFEGLPLDEAAKYGPEDAAILVAMLKDPAEVAFHENIALALGMIGDGQATGPLIDYASGEGAVGTAADEIDRTAAYKGRVGAIVGLGYLVNQTKDPRALAFLQAQASPDAWSGALLEEPVANLADENAARQDLSRYAVLALGLTGEPAAMEFLKSVEQGNSTLAPAFVESIAPTLDQSIKLNADVSRLGIVRYYETLGN